MTLVDEPLDGIRDLELPSRRRLDRLDRLEHRGVEHVDADEGEVGGRHLRLLGEAHHLAVLELGHPELGRVGHAGQENLALGLLLAEARDEGRELLANQVVAEVHAEWVRAQEVLRDEDRVGEPEGGVLLDIGDGDAESLAVADGVPDLLMRVADHDADLADARRLERLYPIEEDRLVGHRNELLGRGEGDGPEPGSAPT